ncbi:protein kinase domain-containing protein [Janthinobacterium agaricidamnosum]|nr:protein kinase [Janthinobacterium agaricidamnosum]
MPSIGHFLPIISIDSPQNSTATPPSLATSADHPPGMGAAPSASMKRKKPDTPNPPSPQAKRPRGYTQHRDISHWLSSQSAHLATPPRNTSRLSTEEGSEHGIHNPFEASFNIEEALSRHAADRWDKREDGLPPTMIHFKNNSTLYSLQFDNKWTNRKVLGEGGQGKVRIACRQDGQVVAVKKYHLDDDESSTHNSSSSIKESEVEYFIYQMLGKGHHFPEVYDIAHVKKGNDIKSYLFMELINGEDGEKVLKKITDGELTQSEARAQIKHIARQYIQAIADMHDKGVASPDMKPANFIHTPSGNVKIIDFGLGKYFPPDQRAQDEFDGFHEDHIQLAGILVSALGRALLGLRSAYTYEENEYDYDALQDEFEEALEAMPEDDETRLDAESLAIFAEMLKDKISPRQLLSENYFAESPRT